MTRKRVATVTLTLSLLAASRESSAASATIDFETVPSGIPLTVGTALTTQYSSLGVIFDYLPPRAAAFQQPSNSVAPHSGAFVAVSPDFAQEFGDDSFEIKFSSLQSLVQLWAGSGCGNVPGTLTAYNCAGSICNVVAPVDSHLMIPGQAGVLFSVATTTPQINKVIFHALISGIGGNCSEQIDDLHIEGDPPPGAGQPPAISLTGPPAGNLDYTGQALQAVGTYAGTNLFQLQVDLVSLDTPSGQPATQSFFQAPSPASGTALPFSVLLKAAGQVGIGRFRVVATIKDFNDQQAQASVDFSNFPPPLVDNDPNLGPFKYSINDENCQVAFYQGGALAKSPQSPFPIPVPTTIAEKWRTVSTPILSPKQTLGCPILPAESPTGFPSWLTQEFERGRIYVPPQGPAVYVPQIFRSALAGLRNSFGVQSEFRVVGWPVADPDYNLEVENPTWVFQRFARQERPPAEAPAYWNTLEIRGRTPVLYVERVGGDPDERSRAQATPNNQSPPERIDASTPTHWEMFPCAKLPTDRWPTSCDLSARIPITGSPVAQAPVAHLCGGEPGCEGGPSACGSHSCPSSGLFTPPPPDWATTVAGNVTFYQGIIRDLDLEGPSPGSHLANLDNPFSHTYCNTTLGRTVEAAGDIGLAILECAGNLIGVSDCDDGVSRGANIDYCRSDWNLHTRPLPTQTNWDFLSEANTFPGNNNVQTPLINFEIEFEAAFATDYFKRFNPVPGDLVTLHGRQIVDCGHCPYRAEIHPPDLMIVERSDVYFPIFGNTGDPQFRATSAYVWANAFLPTVNGNIVPIAAAVRAPPRTSAKAKLFTLHHESGYFTTQNGIQATTQFITGGLAIEFAGPGTPITETDRGQWIYPGPYSPDALIWGSPPPPPPSTLTGPKYVDHVQIAWTAFFPGQL